MNAPSTTRGGGEGPGLFVAAFGKHPGWNDHIDDLGLATPRLVEVKRRMYVEGIGGNIDAGTWDRLSPDQRLEGFDHVFAWRTPGDLVVGRLWSSRDGKGRAKYPMVVCAQASGVPLAWALGEALPLLESLRERCVATESAEAVRAALDDARLSLRRRAEARPPSGPELLVSDRVLTELAERPEMGAGGIGLHRLLYQVEREMPDHLPASRATTRSRIDEARRPHHVRVPACGTEPGEVASLWMRVALTLLSPTSELLLLIPRGAGWVDLIVGPPDPSSFYCLRATPRAVAPVTEVPYDLDPEFVDRARRRIADGSSDEFRAVGEPGRTPDVVVRGGVLSKLAFWKRGKLVQAIGLLAGAALVVAALGMLLSRGDGGSGGASTTRGTSRAPPGDQGSRGPAPGGQAAPTAEELAWRELCGAYRSWFAAFVRGLDEPPARVAPGQAPTTRRELYRSDPVLADLLVRLVEARDDPWSISGAARGADLAALARTVPEPARGGSGAARVARAVEIVRGFEQALSGGLEAIRRLSNGAEAFESRGWTAAASQARAAVAACARRGPDTSADLDRALAASELVRRIEAGWARVERAARSAEASGDPVLRAFGAWATRAAASASAGSDDALAALDDAVTDADRVGTRLSEFLASEWLGIDRESLAASPVHAAFSGDATAQTFEAWLFEARRHPSLDPGLNPVRSWAFPQRSAEVRRQIDRLRDEFGVEAPERSSLAGLQDRAEKLGLKPWNTSTREAIIAEAAAIRNETDELWRSLDRRLQELEAQRVASASEARQRLRTRDQVSATSVAINSAWATWRDAILARYDDARFAEMMVHARAAEQVLTELDDLLGGRLSAAEPNRPWHEALAAACRGERERLIAQATGPLASSPPGPGDGRPALFDRAARQYEAVLSKLGALRDDLDRVHALLDAGYAPGEASADGVTADGLFERWKEDAIASMPGVDRAIVPLRDRLASLAKLGVERNREALAARVESAGASEAAEALVAWRRLGTLDAPAWPAGPDELRTEARLRRAVERIVESMADVERAASLRRELAAEGRARWSRGFAAIRDRSAVREAVGLMPAFGVSADMIEDERLRYNIAACSALSALGGGDPDDEAARGAASSAAAALRAAAPGLAQRPAVAGALAELDSIASGVEPTTPRIDVKALGPGSAGWVGEVIDDGRRIRFSAPGGATTIEFIRVEGPDGAAYVASTEASIGMCGLLSRLPGAAEALRVLLPESDRSGPLGWTLARDGLAPAEAWVARLPAGSRAADYPALAEAGRPTADHPMQHVSAAAAVYLCRLIGCRLPTPGEWRAAREASAIGASAPNLRDESWRRLWASAEAVNRSGRKPMWPDAGVFYPKGFDRLSASGARASAGEGDDGLTWFAPVAGGDGRGNFTGNVAEFVFEDPAGLEAIGEAAPAAVEAALRGGAGRLRVIGASALSPPTLAPDEPLAVDEFDVSDRVGYADVGFRPAFSASGSAAPRLTPGQRLRRLLTPDIYLLD